MDGIVQALGSFFSNSGGGANWGNILKTGALGAGGGLDLFSDIRNLQQLGFQRNLENPTNAANWIAKATAPLNKGLIQGVGNATQGYLGERGLAESPAVTAGVLSQNLAPYEQQNQQVASNALSQLLGSRTPYPQVNLGSLMKLFKPTPGWDSTGGAPGSFP